METFNIFGYGEKREPEQCCAYGCKKKGLPYIKREHYTVNSQYSFKTLDGFGCYPLFSLTEFHRKYMCPEHAMELLTSTDLWESRLRNIFKNRSGGVYKPPARR